MKKAEVIEELLKMGCDKEEISQMGVAQLRDMLEEEQRGADSLIILNKVKEDLESEDSVKYDPQFNIDTTRFPINSPEEIALETKQAKDIVGKKELYLSDPPTPTDAGWVQHVLSLFLDDELENQNPRMEALRRISELLIGEIVEERSELISAPTPENGDRACAKATIIFSNGQIFEALADACPTNCQKEFSMFSTAMADTRAKGRAYRAALRLRRVVAAEEVGISTQEEDNPNRLINTGQVTAIRLLSDRLGISIQKLLLDLEIVYETKDNIANLSTLKYAEGLILLNRLNNIRQEGIVQDKLKR